MQTIDACEINALQIGTQNTEAGTFRTWIIDGMVLGGVHRIDAQTTAFTRRKRAIAKMLPLSQAIEDQMISHLQKVVEPIILVSRAEHMRFAAQFFFAKTRFVQTAGRRTAKHLANLRIALVDTEGFLCEKNARTAFVHNVLQNLQIGVKDVFINNKIGGLHPL